MNPSQSYQPAVGSGAQHLDYLEKLLYSNVGRGGNDPGVQPGVGHAPEGAQQAWELVDSVQVNTYQYVPDGHHG